MRLVLATGVACFSTRITNIARGILPRTVEYCTVQGKESHLPHSLLPPGVPEFKLGRAQGSRRAVAQLISTIWEAILSKEQLQHRSNAKTWGGNVKT